MGMDHRAMFGAPSLCLSIILLIKFRAFFSYTYVESKDPLDIDVTRYERDLAGRGDEMQEYFFGINYFFYGHKLKWQNAIQYTEMDNLVQKYMKVGVTPLVFVLVGKNHILI